MSVSATEMRLSGYDLLSKDINFGACKTQQNCWLLTSNKQTLSKRQARLIDVCCCDDALNR